MAKRSQVVAVSAEAASRAGVGDGVAGGEAVNAASPAALRDGDAGALLSLAVSTIHPSSVNPRKVFDEDGIVELASSIRASGLIQPIVVRRDGGMAGHFEIVAGERRWRAFKLLERDVIPAIVRAVDDDASLRVQALVENLARRDLNAVEEARGYRDLREASGWTVERVAESVGRSRSAVSNAMRLLELPEDVLAMVASGELSEAHGRAIVRFAPHVELMRGVAALAMEGVASKTIEDKGFLAHYGYSLRNKGVLLDVNGYEWKFDRSVCKTCPFDAYLENRYCARPEHAKELQRAYDDANREANLRKAEEQQKALQKQLDEAKASQASASTAAQRKAATSVLQSVERAVKAAGKSADGDGPRLPDLSKLQSGSWTEIGSGSGAPPAGCSEACPCRLIGTYYNRTCTVCVDANRYRSLRYRSLQSAATRAAQKERKPRMAALKAGVMGADTPERRRRALVMLCYMALHDGNSAPRLRGEAAAAFADRPQLAAVLRESYAHGRDLLAELYQFGEPVLERLVLAIGRAKACHEIDTALEHKSDSTPFANFLIGGAAKHPAVAEESVEMAQDGGEAVAASEGEPAELQDLALADEGTGDSGAVAPPPVEDVDTERVAMRFWTAAFDLADSALTAVGEKFAPCVSASSWSEAQEMEAAFRAACYQLYEVDETDKTQYQVCSDLISEALRVVPGAFGLAVNFSTRGWFDGEYPDGHSYWSQKEPADG